MTRDPIDFHFVRPEHEEIHDRLRNWAAWCEGRAFCAVLPMFRFYRADNFGRGGGGSVVDALDAAEIQKLMPGLPEPHRHALQWWYIKPVGPSRAARALGLSLAGLALMVHDGRTMCMNRLRRRTGVM